MPLHLKTTPILILCLLLSAPALAGDKKQLAGQRRQAAETFINSVIKKEYKSAYGLFTDRIKKKNPFPLFATIQKSVNRKLGNPVSYAFDKETVIPPPTENALRESSKSYRYRVIFKDKGQKTEIPLVITFGKGKAAAQIYSFKYLKDQMKIIKPGQPVTKKEQAAQPAPAPQKPNAPEKAAGTKKQG